MATDVVKQIRKATRRQFTAEEKIRVVLEGLRGDTPVSELCRKHGIQNSIYYKWSKAFLDSGKNGLTRDTQRDATTDEVRRLKDENASLKGQWVIMRIKAQGALEEEAFAIRDRIRALGLYSDPCCR